MATINDDDAKREALKQALLELALEKEGFPTEGYADDDDALYDTSLSTYALPDDETLIKFADGTLRGKERREIQELVQKSPLAGLALASIVQEFTAVRELVFGGRGWKGAWLSAHGALPTSVPWEAWREHLKRCGRTRTRENLIRRFKSGLPIIGADGVLEPSGRGPRTLTTLMPLAPLAGCIVLAVMVKTQRSDTSGDIQRGQTINIKVDPTTTADIPDFDKLDLDGIEDYLQKFKGRRQAIDHLVLAKLYQLKYEKTGKTNTYLLTRAYEELRAAGFPILKKEEK
jgi:hypothetical protein